jgi:ABC-type transport system involved in multi-copper enzyme maturation permease subunit
MKSIRYTPWWAKLIAGLILLSVTFGALALLYGIFGKLDDPAKFYLEAAKALFQLVVVLLLGALITAVIKYLKTPERLIRRCMILELNS